MHNFFGEIDGLGSGGSYKHNYMTCRSDFTRDFTFSEPIQTWLKGLYRDLETTTVSLQKSGHPVEWKRQNFKQNMVEVNESLEHVKGNDRVVHDLSGFNAARPWFTFTPPGFFGWALSLGINSKRNINQMEEGISIEGSHKRRRQEDEATNDELSNSSDDSEEL